MLERSRQLTVGVCGGVAAVVVSYLVTYLAVGSAVESSLARQLVEAVGGDLPTWKVVGWVFFNAHAVSTRLPGLLGPESVNLLSQVDAFPTPLYAVPPLVLLGVGAVVGSAAADRAGTGVGVGALVAGYFVVVAVTTMVVSVSIGETTVGPATVPALGLSGLCYPLVFGGLGGVAGLRLSS